MVQGKTNPYENPATGATRPANQVGGYEYLQRADGKSLLETAFDLAQPVLDNPENYTAAQKLAIPFTKLKQGEGTWYNSATYGLELKDSDWTGDSGFFTATVQSGWEIAFVMLTENNDYFEDNTSSPRSKTDWTEDSTYDSKLDNLSKTTPIWVQDNAEFSDSRAAFILVGDNDDYVSVDIDDEVKGIANFQVRIDGVKYASDASKMDNETKIGIKWCRRWNPNMPVIADIPEDEQEDDGASIDPEEVEDESGQGEGDGDGDGDSDGDGDTTDDEDEDYSIFLVVGAVALVIVGSYIVLTRGDA